MASLGQVLSEFTEETAQATGEAGGLAAEVFTGSGIGGAPSGAASKPGGKIDKAIASKTAAPVAKKAGNAVEKGVEGAASATQEFVLKVVINGGLALVGIALVIAGILIAVKPRGSGLMGGLPVPVPV